MKEGILTSGMLQGFGVGLKHGCIFTGYKLFSVDGIVLVKVHKE